MAAYGADADSVAAYLPVSGQTVTHFTIRKERGLPDGIPVVDEYAPVNKARKETAPLVLITGTSIWRWRQDMKKMRCWKLS